MKRPDQNASRIRSVFNDTFSEMNKLDALEPFKAQGELLFTKEDLMAENLGFLDRFIRTYCIKNHITYPYFYQRYRVHALMDLGLDPATASTNRSNLLRRIKDGGITLKCFMQVCAALGLTLDWIVAGVTDSDGKPIVMDSRNLEV